MPNKNISIPLSIAVLFAAMTFANQAFNQGVPQSQALVSGLVNGVLWFAIIRVIMWAISKMSGKK